jgi:SAM-dependent methyltransferase
MESSVTDGQVACAICGGPTSLRVQASERMFGWGGAYRYDMCDKCGCLQLRDVPDRMERFYPSGYYAYTELASPTPARHLYWRVRDAILFGGARAARPLVLPLLPRRISEAGEWLARSRAEPRSRVLDVGCGSGTLLRRLVDAGYEHAKGVDPFIDGDITYRGKLLVHRALLEEVPGQFDVIMLHHSLEHIGPQVDTMASLARMLAPGGTCLIRVPVVDSFSWEEYQDRWVQLDAPRHLFLHSAESMRCLAEGAGLRVERIVYDSRLFQFEGSELYRRDIPLKDAALYPLTRLQRMKYATHARWLNARKRGDQAAFYLRHM